MAAPTAMRVAYSAFHRLRNDIHNAILQAQQTGYFPRKLMDNLFSFKQQDASLPRLYGTIKCHKEGSPLRPICSTVHWYTRPVQQLLLYVLKNLFSLKLCTQNVLSVDNLAREINSLSVKRGYVLVKMDVRNMYGSVDKNKISNLLHRLLHSPNINSPLPPSLLERMYHYSTETACLVKYGDTVYRQIGGLPQGACDSGFLATLYVDTLLQVHYEELFTVHRVHKWWKYVDDLLLYMPQRYVESFKKAFERILNLVLEVDHSEPVTDSKFLELGATSCISFLDLMIIRVDVEGGGDRRVSRFITCKYIKPTASFRMIHALSSTVLGYKTNTIRGGVIKILRRTSNELLTMDLNRYYSQAMCNGYPPYMLEHIFHEVLEKEIIAMKTEKCYLRLTKTQTKQRNNILQNLLLEYPAGDCELIQVNIIYLSQYIDYSQINPLIN